MGGVDLGEVDLGEVDESLPVPLPVLALTAGAVQLKEESAITAVRELSCSGMTVVERRMGG